MIEEKDKTPASAHPRRAGAAGRPLGTLLLAKALGLTADEAAQLRVDAAGTLAEHGKLGTARLWVGYLRQSARRWLEGDS